MARSSHPEIRGLKLIAVTASEVRKGRAGCLYLVITGLQLPGLVTLLLCFLRG